MSGETALASAPIEEQIIDLRNVLHRPAPSGSTASALLTEAARIVAGPRNASHGAPERSFETIAAYWQVYLDNRRDSDAPLRGSDVAGMMGLLKLARDQHSPQPFRDHALDTAGYAGIRGELLLREAGAQ